LFSPDLVLTHVASHVPDDRQISATAKRFRRHLSTGGVLLDRVLANYWRLVNDRLNDGALFIVDITDIAKVRARKLEHLAYVRDADKDRLVPGYWCLEIYVVDRYGILWPVLLWPFSVETETERSMPFAVLQVLSLLDEVFGERFGLFVFDRGFDGRGYIEPFCVVRRHFVIRQRGDRMVVLPNGVHQILLDVIEHLFARRGGRMVYQKVFLPKLDRPLYVVAYRERGTDGPVILLTNRLVENDELAIRIRNIYAQRWDCETAVEFLKSKLGLERFMVQRYVSMQRLIVLAGLAMGFLSDLLSRCPTLQGFLHDPVRYARDPRKLCHFRLIERLREPLQLRTHRVLQAWCRPP
jgi:hypothetical protein